MKSTIWFLSNLLLSRTFYSDSDPRFLCRIAFSYNRIKVLNYIWSFEFFHWFFVKNSFETRLIPWKPFITEQTYISRERKTTERKFREVFPHGQEWYGYKRIQINDRGRLGEEFENFSLPRYSKIPFPSSLLSAYHLSTSSCYANPGLLQTDGVFSNLKRKWDTVFVRVRCPESIFHRPIFLSNPLILSLSLCGLRSCERDDAFLQ